jgi:hypothetical protein
MWCGQLAIKYIEERQHLTPDSPSLNALFSNRRLINANFSKLIKQCVAKRLKAQLNER